MQIQMSLKYLFLNTNVSWIQDRAIQFEGTGIFFHVLCISILLLDMIMEALGIQTVREYIMYIICNKGSVHPKRYEQREARKISDSTSLVVN